MATAATGIWNHTASASPIAMPQDGSSGDGSSSSTASTTISANDFLTLLVTELQNQDPTADTDPNEYVNQLVAVNSLEQLININQTLSTDLGGTSGTGDAQNGPAKGQSALSSMQAATQASAGPQAAHAASFSPGNLSIPAANPAANRVAQALNGRAQ